MGGGKALIDETDYVARPQQGPLDHDSRRSRSGIPEIVARVLFAYKMPDEPRGPCFAEF
jgi:hypothetical protein